MPYGDEVDFGDYFTHDEQNNILAHLEDQTMFDNEREPDDE